MSAEAPAAPVEEKKPDAPAPAEAPKPETPAEAVPEKTFSQKELDEILEKRLAKERRKRNEKEEEIRVLRKLALERPEPAPKREAPAEDKEPVRGDFASYEEFLSAQAGFRARGTAKEVIKEERESQEKVKREEESRKAGESFRSKLKENSTGIEDFDSVMNDLDPNSAVARLPADPIAASDNPAKILYHLATHPDEAERIASLQPGQQAREIWKLDSALAAAKPPAKQPSKAPAPIAPVGGGNTVTTGEMPDPKTDPDGWWKWRQADLRSRLGKRA